MKHLSFIALLVALFYLVIWIATSVTIVEWSWTTQECVRVIPPEAGSCDQLPDRYERRWVK